MRVLGTPNICHVLTSHWPSLPVPRPSFSPPLLRYRSVHVRSRGEGKGSRAVMGGWYVGFVMVDSLTPMFFCPLTPVGGTAPSVRLESHRGLESCPSPPGGSAAPRTVRKWHGAQCRGRRRHSRSSKGESGSLRACRVLSVAGYYRSGVSALLRPGGRRAGLPSGSEETTRGVGILCRSLDACCCTQVCASRRLTPRRPPRSSSDILLQRSVRFLCIILL